MIVSAHIADKRQFNISIVNYLRIERIPYFVRNQSIGSPHVRGISLTTAFSAFIFYRQIGLPKKSNRINMYTPLPSEK